MHITNFESLATCSYVNIIRLLDDALSILWGFPLDQICQEIKIGLNIRMQPQCNRSTTLTDYTFYTQILIIICQFKLTLTARRRQEGTQLLKLVSCRKATK